MRIFLARKPGHLLLSLYTEFISRGNLWRPQAPFNLLSVSTLKIKNPVISASNLGNYSAPNYCQSYRKFSTNVRNSILLGLNLSTAVWHLDCEDWCLMMPHLLIHDVPSSFHSKCLFFTHVIVKESTARNPRQCT